MRPPRQLVSALLLAAVLLAGCADNGDRRNQAAGEPPAAGVTEVVAKDMRFSPATIQVPAGTEVTWSFQDGQVPHNVHGDGWCSGDPQRSGSFRTPSTGPAPTTTPAPCPAHDRPRGGHRRVVSHHGRASPGHTTTGGTSMRTAAVAVLALVGGFVVGIVVSEIIGIAGFLLFDSLVGFRFLPLVSTLVAAGAAVAVNLRARRRSTSPAPIQASAADHQAVRRDPGS